MVFSSLLFLFRFLPLVLLFYFVTPRKYRNVILFLASLVFYAWGEPVYVCLLLFSSVVDYTCGRGIGYFRRNHKKTGMKGCLLASLVINLGLLAVFKYADFFMETIGGITGNRMPLLHLALPIGISFYTFQTLSYTIDVYRGKVKPQHNFITFASYVALFPQLIAGPIVRYQTVERELEERKENLDDFSSGIFRFSVGLAKKVLLANTTGALFHEIAALPKGELSVLTAWLGVLAFTFQIYFDFSGYSDMAIGLGRMFGFHFLENFRHPYESASITEFWRRWHISLGTWFKEYVYIPMGGNRKGFGRQIINIAVVWLLTGFWHGASWNFVLWGIYYGLLLMVEKLFLLTLLNRLPRWVGRLYTMLLVLIGWAFFCYPDLQYGGDFVQALLGQASKGMVDSSFWYFLSGKGILLVIAAVGSTALPLTIWNWLTGTKRGEDLAAGEGAKDQPAAGAYTLRRGIAEMVWVTVCLIGSITFLIADTFNPFLYFRF